MGYWNISSQAEYPGWHFKVAPNDYAMSVHSQLWKLARLQDCSTRTSAV